MLPLRQVKPKNARSKRYLDHKAPQTVEHARTTLFLKYTTTSEAIQLVVRDLIALKRPLVVKFDKKNNIHPFEDASSLEFFADRNDASMLVLASHSKKRPHCLTLVRTFDYKVLDMLELLVDAETLRTISQFRTQRSAGVGLKPLLAFSGSAWDDAATSTGNNTGSSASDGSDVRGVYSLAKSLLLEMFKGPDAGNVDVEGLQYMIHFSVDEQTDVHVRPAIHMRCYLLRTKKSGANNLPKVELEEMGPRIDFRVGRVREADPEMMKEAMRKPKSLEAKTKKNVETDIIGDKVGRIHVGRQDIGQLQTRKMKGLKRSRDVAGDDGDVDMDDVGDDSGEVVFEPEKRAKIQV